MGSPFLLVLALALVGVAQCANPNYSYHVKVEDPAHANFQEKAETRKGPDAVGFYSVVEPNGALRTVQYTANDDGFNPTVTYSYGGTSVYHNSGAGVSTVGTYAPAYVQDQRVQIVDKLTGTPPALNVQPFALPAPSLGVASGPVVVPAPVRAAPAPQLIAQAEGVEYAPAYMPPVTAFVERAPAPVAYAPAPVAYAPAPVAYAPAKVSYAPAPTFSYAPAYAPTRVSYAPAPVYGPPTRAYLPPPPPRAPAPVYGPPVKAYLPPPPPPAVYEVKAPVYGPPPPPPVKTYLPPPQVFAVEKPQVLLSVPKKPAVIAVAKAPVKVVDSYAAPPINTVTDYSAPVYPEAIKVKPGTSYGPPDFVPGKPLSTDDLAVAAPVRVEKPKTQVHVTVVQPAPEPLPVPQKVVQYAPAYAPVVQKVYQPAPVQVAVPVAAPVVQKVVQPQYQYAYAQPQPVAKVVAQAPVPVVSAYAGAIGYHTQTSGPSSYLHSYGSPGFQVTSSRQYNKAVLTTPVVQQTYAPKYVAPAPVAVAAPAPVAYAAPAPVAYAAPAYAAPAPAPVAVAAPAPVAVAAAPAPLAIAGKKQNPLTFQYSYDQGSAKVSHSYSGSGW